VCEIDARLSTVGGIVRGEQATVDQMPQDRIEVGGIIIGGAQLRARLLPPGVGATFAEADQPEQGPACERHLRRIQRA
jgi:hypothetical protein